LALAAFVSARRGFAMRILVVEDERVAADVLAKGLREHAYAVDVASDGAAALEQAGANDYDLIILDLLLPHMNGIDQTARYVARIKAKLRQGLDLTGG
jgi:DNA-binding response OmpR family regulator